jgi:hypothetical protein
MLGNFQPHLVEYLRFLPEILLSLFGIAIMMLEAVAPPESTRRTIGAISVVGVIAAFVAMPTARFSVAWFSSSAFSVSSPHSAIWPVKERKAVSTTP